MPLRNVRLWVGLFFAIRLVGIMQPPVEMAHSWRQTFTCMVARNLVEVDFDLLHPRTDMAGDRPDVVASEFPFLNALIAMAIKTFGFAHWYGRLIVLLISSIGVLAFHAIVQRRYGERVALLSALVLLASSWFMYGRKIMPDAFSISLVIMGLYFADRVVAGGNRWLLLPGMLLVALGGLCKMPAIVLGALWPLFAWEAGLRSRAGRSLLMASVLAVLPVAWWYFLWQPHLLETFGNQLYFPFAFRDGIRTLLDLWPLVLEKFYFSALRSFVALVFCLWGIRILAGRSPRELSIVLAAVMLPFLYFMVRTGDVFPRHDYYVLPVVPLMALVAGVGLAGLSRAWLRTALVVLICAEGLLNQVHDLRWNTTNAYLLQAGALADRFSGPHDLVACNGDLDPRLIYYLHRKGWSLTNEELQRKETLEMLRSRGCRAIIVNLRHGAVDLPARLLYQDEHYRVYLPQAQEQIDGANGVLPE
ncbi:MAG: glycosyltransferase family 39 protein [Flavobacteriales bacterium]|nr:glycosyltransferase family 39 protein [Flavobacteriales bacterium]